MRTGLLAAGLVVYNILKIAVIKHIKEYGVLRAIGAEKGKLYLLVSLQLAILCGIGIPAEILLGLLFAWGVTTAASSFFNPAMFLASSEAELAVMIAQNAGGKQIPLLVSGGITIVFALVSAMPAAQYAARVSPALAMPGQTAAIRRRNRKAKQIRSFEAFYAHMNMKRNRGRTAVTILSLVMSITVFVASQSFSELLDASKDVQKMHFGDYSVTSKALGFSPEELAELKNVSGIQSVSTLKYSLYQQDENGELNGMETFITPQPGETMQIIGIDEERLEGLDSPVTLENEGFVNGIQVVVSDSVYDKITQKNEYTALYPTLTQEADRSSVERAIQELCGKTAECGFLMATQTGSLRKAMDKSDCRRGD